jgi:hypothetical protein
LSNMSVNRSLDKITRHHTRDRAVELLSQSLE